MPGIDLPSVSVKNVQHSKLGQDYDCINDHIRINELLFDKDNARLLKEEEMIRCVRSSKHGVAVDGTLRGPLVS